MNKKTEKATISKHFLNALINSDLSGMDDDEIKLLDNYLDKNNYGHCVIPHDDYDTNFKRCEITNLYSDCIDVEFYLR